MGRFEQSALVTDVRAWCDTDTANLRRQGVGDVVTVQVHTGDNVVLSWTQQDLLQERIGDHIFNDDLFAGVRVLDLLPRAAVDQFTTELFRRQLVAPVFEGTFGELHDIAFVNDGHRVTVVGDGIVNRCTNQAFGSFFGARFDTDTAMLREADFLHAHLFAQELDHFFCIGRVGFPLDTRVDIFGVLTEDNHVGQFWVFNRAWGALVVTHRTQAHVQVEFLTQCNVQRANTATDWGSQRAFDGNAVVTNQIQRLSWQPDVLAINVGRFFTGVNFHPGNFTLAFVGFLNSGIHHFQHRWGYVNADTVTFDERDNRIVWNVQLTVLQGDLFTFRRNNYFAFH